MSEIDYLSVHGGANARAGIGTPTAAVRKYAMRDVENLRQDMEFQLSLLRLVTVPHQAEAKTPAKAEGEEQLERLFEVAESDYQN